MCAANTLSRDLQCLASRCLARLPTASRCISFCKLFGISHLCYFWTLVTNFLRPFDILYQLTLHWQRCKAVFSPLFTSSCFIACSACAQNGTPTWSSLHSKLPIRLLKMTVDLLGLPVDLLMFWISTTNVSTKNESHLLPRPSLQGPNAQTLAIMLSLDYWVSAKYLQQQTLFTSIACAQTVLSRSNSRQKLSLL